MSIQQAAVQAWQNEARKAKAEGREIFTRKSKWMDKRDILLRKEKEDALIDLILDCANRKA